MTDVVLLTRPLILTTAWFNSGGSVIEERAVEVRVFESESLIQRIEALAVQTQVSRDATPLMSISRYFTPLHSWLPYLRGAEVLISGCGSGGELLAVMALGARRVVGVEIEGPELELAQALCRHAEGAQLLPYSPGLPNVPLCDVVLSRHVIEHVADRQSYLTELLQRLKPGGYLLLEAPNQACPIEPHTATRFFHWLSPQQQDRAIRYLRARADVLPQEREWELLSRIQGHRNADVGEIATALEGVGVIEDRIWSDSTITVPDIVEESGDTFRLVIRHQ